MDRALGSQEPSSVDERMMRLICNLGLYALKLGGDEDLLLW
jgi:hypothetical protein